MNRTANFFAGPSTLPIQVLEQLRDTIVDFEHNGLSLLETSHRSGMYETVHDEAKRLIRELLSVPSDFSILFIGGGATLQFSMVPLNLLSDGGACDFVVSGSWAKKALDDAKKVGKVNVLFDGKETGYSSLPADVSCSPDAAYLHITTNETIDGIQWRELPGTGSVPIVADMSSDIMSRPIDFSSIGTLYAGAQKNLGPAGVTVVIIRNDIVDRCSANLTAYLSYRTHVDKDSLYNTPPVFSIYALMLVLRWLKKRGGVPAIQAMNRKKASRIYEVIDASEGFFVGKPEKSVRSVMNIVFNLKTAELEQEFLSAAESAGMLGLKGHRSVGGCRASLYNALPVEWADQLAELMREFSKAKG